MSFSRDYRANRQAEQNQRMMIAAVVLGGVAVLGLGAAGLMALKGSPSGPKTAALAAPKAVGQTKARKNAEPSFDELVQEYCRRATLMSRNPMDRSSRKDEIEECVEHLDRDSFAQALPKLRAQGMLSN